MTPRYATAPPRRAPSSSLEEFRAAENGDGFASLEHRAFWRFLLQPVPPGMNPRELLDEDEQRVLSKATNAAGGYLAPTDMNEQIVSAARASSAIAQVSLELVTGDGGNFLLPTTTTHGVATWTAENVGYTASDEVFGQPTLSAFKAASWVVVSEELMQDSRAPLDAYLANELGQRIGDLEDAAFSVGDGSGKPLGVVHASSPYSVTTASAGSTLKFTPADLLAAWKALAPAYRPNATWIMAADDLATLQGSTDTAGGFAIPSLQSPTPSLFGRPVLIGPNMPAPGVSAKSAIVGDFSRAYCIRRVSGIAVDRLNELASTTGQVVVKARERLDGRPALSAAAQVLQHSAT
jgi:HK97 family phage major capsid protein